MKLSKTARKILRENTRVDRSGRGNNQPRLIVGNQSFTIGFACDLATAKWQLRQLAYALARLVEEA